MKEWTDIYPNEKHKSLLLAKHQVKYKIVEDAHNKKWKQCIVYDTHLTFYESHCTGWYPGGLTKGPKPKPI